MGFPTNSRKWRREWTTKMIGKDVADWVLNGISVGIPLDISLRIGVQNLIPGTSMLKKSSRDRGREVAEVFGPAAGLVVNYGRGMERLAKGDAYRGTKEMMPLAVKNMMGAIEMWSTGEYRNTRGYLTTGVDKTDAVIKGIGFNPSVVASESRVMTELYDDRAIRDQTEAAIADKWAKGIYGIQACPNPGSQKGITRLEPSSTGRHEDRDKRDPD